MPSSLSGDIMIIKVLVVVGVVLAGIYLYRKFRRFRVVKVPYNGELANDPKVKLFYDNIEKLTNDAVQIVSERTQKPAPPITVRIGLTDEFENDPFLTPSAASSCEGVPVSNSGNCETYKIRFGTKPLAADYKGRTTAFQILCHELTHIYMWYYVKDIENMPNFLIEGVPIDVAGQAEQIKSVQRQLTGKHTDRHQYGKNEISLDEYTDLIEAYKESGLKPADAFPPTNNPTAEIQKFHQQFGGKK